MSKRLPSTAWKKGQSGNPKGAPQKDESITFLMNKFLESCPEGQEKTYKQIFVEKAYAKAVKDGDVTAQKMIWNYIDGLPQGFLDLTSKGQKISLTQMFDTTSEDEETE